MTLVFGDISVQRSFFEQSVLIQNGLQNHFLGPTSSEFPELRHIRAGCCCAAALLRDTSV